MKHTVGRVVAWLDALQQRKRWLGFPYAVYQKSSDDYASNLASLLAYSAFSSVFPLLLVLLTTLGFVLHDDPHLEARVFRATLGQIPFVGQDTALRPLVRSVPALVIGSVLALWNGLGVAQQAQVAFDTIYNVPRKDWPGFVPRTLRSLVAVVVGGTGLIATTLLSGITTGASSYGPVLGTGLRVLTITVAVVLDAFVFTVLFRFLTVRPLSWREALPGAFLAAGGWYALQLLGTSLFAHEYKSATSTYGTFAAVIGLIAFFQAQALLTVYAAEVNAVRLFRLWPRGLSSMTNVPTTEADHRSYQSYAERDRFAAAEHEQIRVTFDPTPADVRAGSSSGDLGPP